MADPTGTILVRGGRVVDADGERMADVLIEGERITAVGPDVADHLPDRTLDAGGCLVAPGLVDLHAHLREPGREEAETIESGSRCAALGGYTAVVAMPNTTPAIDSAGVVREVQDRGRVALCDVFPSGAITVGRAGEQLAPMAEMAGLGVRLFTDDGSGVQDNRLMRRAMEYASGLGVTLAQHCEDEALCGGGHMHEGEWSSRLGIPGQPAEAEELMVMRDITLSRLTGARIHFQHLSTARSIELVRRAKAGGLADGTIDAIATDHAPHAQEDKDVPFDQARPGMLGLETALALALTELDLSIPRVLRLLSWQPAAIAGVEALHGGPVAEGRP
ncbi:MAG: dihydroorotase, partial [Actinomycetota bacterium]|nr:dihydroorotase [Actinomycetota bacterium]